MKHLTHGVQLLIGGLLVLAGVSPLNAASLADAEPTPPDSPSLQAFQLVTAASGWVLLGQHLYWTDSGGAAGQWTDITPRNVGADPIGAVTFSDRQRGWLIAISPADTGRPRYVLARTSDAGRTWQTTALDLFAPGDGMALAGAAFLQFLDARIGWLSVKRASSSNFSLGALFKTTDGGDTWTRLSIPIGGPVHFTSEQDGTLEDSARSNERYVSHDGGQTWTQNGSGPTAGSATDIQGLSQVSMATSQAGWAKRAQGNCQAQACVLVTELLRTADGWQTWVPVRLPDRRLSIQQAFSAPSSPATAQSVGGLTLTLGGAGFDACFDHGLPALADMQNWVANSPYRVWNLYIGGESRYSGCATFSAAYLQELAQQGWLFIPTWVGLQAPCSNFAHRIDPNPTTAYGQGVVSADLALAAASNLGLTLPDKSGAVLYFDLEWYDASGDQGCRDAAKAFISGWTGELHAKGNQAGVYGAPCHGYLQDFVSISNVPDMVWPAVWSFSGYDPGASVWNLPCLGNSLWVNSQRMRQYAGAHDETWNGLTYNIDSDVITASVATVPGNCFPSANQVALFVYPNFAGQCVLKTIGGYPNAATLSLPPKSISSVRVGANVSLHLCRGELYGGVCQDFSGDDANLAHDSLGANQASSAAVQPTALSYSNRLWLPIIFVNGGASLLLPNGDFESGPNLWITSSVQQRALIGSSTVLAGAGMTPHSGNWAAWLGGADSETSTLQQTVMVPSGATNLAYWQQVNSLETGCSSDFASVWINNAVVDSYGLCAASNSLGWTQHVVNLSAYAGSVVSLRIQVVTDSSAISSLFVDDVGFQAYP